jgi:hypothetical protein
MIIEARHNFIFAEGEDAPEDPLEVVRLKTEGPFEIRATARYCLPP